MRTVSCVSVLFLCGGHLAAAQPADGPLKPIRIYDAPAVSFDSDEGAPATDLSGIACMPAKGEKRLCLVINDQDTFAQFAELGPNGLAPGRTIPLLKKGPTGPSGLAPSDTACSKGDGGFKDLDGEGVTYSAPFFYVIGSHGCSRKKRKFHASAFVTARFRVDGSGTVVNPETGATLDAADDPVQSTYRVADALKLAPGVSAFYGQDLNEASGLNIEGIIVASGQLFAGLRAPSQNQGSFLIGIKVEDLFKPGSEPLTEAPLVAPVRLKQDQGIRDLALMDDGRFLVLSGPAQNQNVPYSLFIVDPTVKSGSGFKSDFLIDLESVPDGKAEALQIVGQTGDKLRLLVLFDSLPNGGAREYEVAIN